MRLPLLFVFCATVVFSSMFDVGDWDFWWHLRAGEEILESASVQATDSFSHTFAGAPWRYSESLGQLVFALVFRQGGIAAIIVFKAAIALAGFLLLLRLVTITRPDSSRASASFALPVVAVVLSAFASVFRLTERPEIFLFVLFPATLVLLERIARAPRRTDLAALVVLVALWSNLHRSALLGASVTFLYAVLASIPRLDPALASARRHLLFAAVGSLAALLANPHGLAILSTGGGLVAGILGDPLPYSEWAPPTLSFFLRDSPASAILIIAAIVVAALRFRVPPRRVIALFAATVIAGIFSARFIPLAAMAAAWVLSTALANVKIHRAAPFAAVALLLIADVRLLTSRSPFPGARPVGIGLKETWFPSAAAAFLDATRPPGKIFNAFHFGGYLAWRLKGVYRNFIDGRSDTVFPRAFIAKVGRAARAPEAFEQVTRAYGADIALVSWSNRSTEWMHIATLRDWRLVFWDDITALYVRENDANREWLSRHAFRALTVVDPPTLVATADAPMLERLRVDVDRNVAIAPRAARAHLVRAFVYRRLGNEAVARESESISKEIIRRRGLE